MLLTAEDISQRLSSLTGGAETQAAPPPPSSRLAPAWTKIQDWIEYVRDPTPRWQLGLKEIDGWVRGFRPHEMIAVTGFSQSGKSQVVNTSIINNPDKPFIWWTWDEPAEMVLAKLTGMLLEEPGDYLEDEVKAGNSSVIAKVQGVVKERLPNLFIVDDSRFSRLTDDVKQAEDYCGQPIGAAGMDYLAIIPMGEGVTGVIDKADHLKGWIQTEANFPVFVIYQNSRSGGSPGEPVTLTSMAYGGEQQATIILGVRRKRDWKELDEYQAQAHANTVSVSAVKNKRPPAKTGEHDYYMNPNTGLITSIQTVEEVGWKERFR